MATTLKLLSRIATYPSREDTAEGQFIINLHSQHAYNYFVVDLLPLKERILAHSRVTE